MKSSAYLYNLFGNKGIIRRDLPVSKFSSATSEELETNEISRSLEARGEKVREILKAPKPQQPKLVSSSQGKINSMLLTIPNETEDIAPIYKKLLETMPESTNFVCLVNYSSIAIVEEWLKTYKRDEKSIVVEAPDYVGFSIWAQDGYAISTSSDKKTYFVEPLSFLRYADAVVADYVTNATDIKDFQVPLYFQGGNILVGDNFWLIGADYPKKTLEYIDSAIFPEKGEAKEEFVKRLFRDNLDVERELFYIASQTPVPVDDVVLTKEDGKYCVDMVFVGNDEGTVQPLFHIDMFLTLAGRDANGKYQIFVGDPSLAPMPPSVMADSYTMQNVYDSIADSLKSKGFTVIRNPLPLTFSKQTVKVEELNNPKDEKIYRIYQQLHNLGLTEVELRNWYFATSNNALVEITDSCKRVWLPTYGYDEFQYLQDSDKKNQEIWENLGFEVTMLPNCHILASGLGAVHCIQKYLDRG